MSDNIIVTSHEELGNETAGVINKTPDGDYVPYGFAGIYIGPDTMVCGECATDDEIRADDRPLDTSSELDYPGWNCERCNKWLDTYLLVYQGQDPELHWKLTVCEQFDLSPDSDTVEIAKEIEKEAYRRGYADGGPIDIAALPYEDRETAANEDPTLVEPPTDSARWSDTIAPKLRALCGYTDSTGKGTFTHPTEDTAYHIFNEGAIPKYREGYADARLGKDAKH